MSMSPEYPDLAWSVPAAYGTGRDGKAVRYIVVHYTAGSETRTSAEDGAAYDRTRTDGTSTHYFVDQDSIVQEVRTADRANAAFGKGNRLGIQYELCGTAQSRAQWLDAASDATLTNAARQMARDAQKYGIPVRKLSVAEVRATWDNFPNGPKGFCGHADITLAYGQGDHMDPGPEFPWDVLLARVQNFVDGKGDMAELTRVDWDMDALEFMHEKIAGGNLAGRPMGIVVTVREIKDAVVALDEKVTALSAGGVTPEALVAALMAALTDPAVRATLVDAAREGANKAEDS